MSGPDAPVLESSDDERRPSKPNPKHKSQEFIQDSDSLMQYVVKKRIGVSGDNLVDASASVDQFNRPIVSLRFDSLG